jgi:hypothetical protein
MAKIYTDKADRKRMSGQAMALLSEKRIHFSDNAECPTGPSGGCPTKAKYLKTWGKIN